MCLDSDSPALGTTGYWGVVWSVHELCFSSTTGDIFPFPLGVSSRYIARLHWFSRLPLFSPENTRFTVPIWVLFELRIIFICTKQLPYLLIILRHVTITRLWWFWTSAAASPLDFICRSSGEAKFSCSQRLQLPNFRALQFSISPKKRNISPGFIAVRYSGIGA